MGHGITERDGSFTVRQPAWHGLSTVLNEWPTREEAQKIAHPWEPVSEPVYRRIPRLVPHVHGMNCTEYCREINDLETVYEEIEDYKAMVRDDDGYTLGVVSSTFEPVLNTEMYDIAEAIEGDDADAVMYETGGSLKGGAKVWLLMRLREPLRIDGDPHGDTIPYYALQNDHTGGGAFRGQGLFTRIVCDNTAQMADLEAQQRGTEFVFRHTRNVKERIEQAQRALAGWRESVTRYNALMNRLINVEVTPAQRWDYIEQFIPSPPPAMASDRVLTNVQTARDTLANTLNSITCQEINHTAYGLVQASIEYAEHFRAARSRESRFKRAYLDRSVITSDAMDLALAVAGTSREAVVN